MTDTQDVLEVVARYAPTANTLRPEWSPRRASDTLAGILDADRREDAPVISLRFLPSPAAGARSRWSRLLPLAASAAVLALAAGVLVAVLPADRSGNDSGGRTHGPAFTPPAGLSSHSITDAQFAYRVTEQLQLDAQGRPDPSSDFAMTMREYVAPDGRIVSIRTGQQNGCFTFAGNNRGTLDEPTRAFLASLPTGVGKLNRYLRSHVQGSSSHDEAVFTAVRDVLREYDGLASPRLRAAMVAVLSRTPGVTLHYGQRDYLDRAALRLDFVDQRIRPGEVTSLYFDSTTFQLLEERSGRNGEPIRYSGPSPAYDGHGQTGRDPGRLSYPATISLMRSEQVVTNIWTCPAGK